MLRTVAKWYISRAIDCDQPLPGWVARRIELDPILQQFYRQSKQLAARLQAARFCHELEKPPQVFQPPVVSRSVGRIAVVGFAFAAVILLMLSPSFRSRFEREPALRSTEQAVAPRATRSMSGEEIRDFQALLSSSGELLQSVNVRTVTIAKKLESPVLGAQQLAEVLDLQADEVAEQVVEPAGQVGAVYGQLLTGVEKQVAEDNQRLLVDGIEAWNYFVYQVPRHAASLAGWSAQQ